MKQISNLKTQNPKRGKSEKIKQSSKLNSINYNISLEELLEAGCHFGHQAKRWNPKMAPYIWKAKEGIHIFDLAKTADLLQKACQAVFELVSKGGIIVFLGTKKQAKTIIKEEAMKAHAPYVNNRWLGGTISNWEQIEKSLHKLKDMKEKQAKGEYEKYTKKENLLLQKEINRLTDTFGGIADLKKIPEAIFVIDTKREIAAIKEAKLKGVTIFAIVDTNSDPDDVSYPIPANDDAVGSIQLIVSKFASAVADGVKFKEGKNEH